MSKFIHHFLRSQRELFLFVVFFLFVHFEVNAGTQPPDPGGDPSGGGVFPVGGGAPVGEGVGILLTLLLFYLLWKLTPVLKKKVEINC